MTPEFRAVNPFPGLRPFRDSEAHLFFGRSEPIDGLLAELSGSRFVAVMGASGSGKSSLVTAGLLPALHGGFSVGVGSHWRIVGLRPGRNPIHNLARTLVGLDGHTDPTSESIIEAAGIEATLRRSSLGLADVANGDGLTPDGRLLVVVDQFEELFRYRDASSDEGRREDAASFVQLLIEATRDGNASIDVVITMRSDFLGDCAEFRELPEIINRGLFLVPRLTRAQLREAITAPAAVAGAAFAPRLVQRLLNDAGTDPDVLPVLQHALMRTWDLWADETGGVGPIDLAHYEKAGGLEAALSRHADEAYFELDGDRQRAIAEIMFKRLTELAPDRREVRRPTPLAEIAEVAEATPDEVEEVIGHFQAQGRSFLTVSADDVVDISHESLIRQWPRLSDWVGQEAESRDVYLRLADAAERWTQNEAALLRNPDLQIAANWWNQDRPNSPWAERYSPGFAHAAAYLDRSRGAAGKRRALAATAVGVLVLLTVASTLLALFAVSERNRAETATAVAVSRQLATQSMSQRQHDRPLSVLTALEAMRAGEARGLPIPVAEQALRLALQDPLSVRLPGPTGERGHEGPIRAVAFIPDRSLLATAGDDFTTLLWSLDNPAAEPTVLDPHDGIVNVVVASRDGGWLATGSADKTARLWDLADTTRPPIPLTGHQAPITSMAFSQDSRWLATGSDDNTARLWLVDDPEAAPRVLPHDGFVLSLDFSPDGSRLVTGSGDRMARVWAVDDPEAPPVKLERHTDHVVAVAFAADGQSVATASLDSTVMLWDLGEPSAPLHVLQHEDSVDTVAFSGDGRWLASGSRDRTARLWDVTLEKPGASPRVLQHSGAVETLQFDPESRWLATGSRDNVVELYELDDLDTPNSESLNLGGHEGPITSLDFSQDSSWLATGSDDGTARLWDLDDLATRPAVLGEEGDVADLAFSLDGRFLATGMTDRIAMHLRLVDDPASPQRLFEDHPRANFELAGVTAVAFSPDGQRIAAGAGDEIVRVWDLDDPDGTEPLRLPASEFVTDLAFSLDRRWLAVGIKNQSAWLWDLEDLSEPMELPGHDVEVTSLAFSPGSEWLATASWDTAVLLWSLDDLDSNPRRLEDHADLVTAVVFSPDGRRLATGSEDETVRIWNLDGVSPTVEHVLETDGPVTDVAYASDGRLIVSAGRTVQLWDLTGSDPADPIVNPVVLTDQHGEVRAVASPPEGRWFATAHLGGTVLLWRPLDHQMDLACDAAGRNLTRNEWRALFVDKPYRKTCEMWPEGPSSG